MEPALVLRIPRHVEEKGRGYLEDRRPGANCDPYRVGAALLKTICDIDLAAAADSRREGSVAYF